MNDRQLAHYRQLLPAIAALPARWYAAQPIPDRLIRDMRLEAPTHLTPPQLDALRSAARGLTRREDARERWISPETVKTHRQQVLRRLGARTMPHAVALAFAQHILTADDLSDGGDDEKAMP